jgi:hypothetical protein
MLMPVACRDERLAALRLMHTLDEVQFFEFFKRAIDGDQTERAIFPARHIEDLNGGEGMHGTLHGLDNRTARAGNAISIFLQLGQPGLCAHLHSFLKLKIIFNKYTKQKAGRQEAALLSSVF